MILLAYQLVCGTRARLLSVAQLILLLHAGSVAATAGSLTFAGVAFYPGYTVNANDPLCAALVFGGAGGSLSIINRVPININALRTSGMDISASYATELWGGMFNASFMANYVDEITINSLGVHATAAGLDLHVIGWILTLDGWPG